jgi:ABC-type uncharacterized transport system permease subunit
MLYSPTIILIGRAPLTEIHSIITTQLIWVFIMGGICKLTWNAGKNKLIIQGG